MNPSGAFIVVDLGFGDAGKGHLVDFLVRKSQAGVVVRYNGGAQAGHNVVTPEGLHHTFSQFGSGAFVPGVKTILSRHMVIHPGALLVEANVLVGKGVQDPLSRLWISSKAPLITPYHQAANRIKELCRGDARHGSCGVGVGEVCEDQIAFPEDILFAADLLNPGILTDKLERIRVRMYRSIMDVCGSAISQPEIQHELQVFTSPQFSQFWVNSLVDLLERQVIVEDALLYEMIHKTDTVVFEGAQGMLIDRDYGFAPYYSWTDSTSTNAHEILNEAKFSGEVETIGVMRCYAVRHGPGPLPTEDKNLSERVFDHNQQNGWQGNVRYGWLDLVLAKYALKNSGGIDSLAITHLDLIPRLSEWKYCNGYQEENIMQSLAIFSKFDKMDDLTLHLQSAQPLYQKVPATNHYVLETLGKNLGVNVKYISSGVTHLDIQYT
jgi:adenylosuccinate synthase